MWAATYDAVDNPLVAMTTFAVEECAWRGARVLELGCGTARNAPAILAAGAREYVGVDASAEMLARGNERVGGDARVRLVVGDVSEAPREQFDVVMFCLVLEHFERLDGALASAAAALREGGELRCSSCTRRGGMTAGARTTSSTGRSGAWRRGRMTRRSSRARCRRGCRS